MKQPKFKIGDLVIVPIGKEDENGVRRYMQGKIFMADINVSDRSDIEWFYGIEGHHTLRVHKKERVYVYENDIELLTF